MINIDIVQGFFSRLSKIERRFLYGALLFIFLALLDRAVIAPSISKMEAQDEEIKEKKMVIRKDLKILSLKDVIEEENEKYKDYFSKSILSEEEEMTSILKEIEKLANDAGVYLVYIRPGDINTDGPFKLFYVNLNCEGEMSKVVEFLYSMEVSSKLFIIDKYVIAPKAVGSSIAQCKVTAFRVLIP